MFATTLLWTASTRSAVEEKANLIKSNHKTKVDFIIDPSKTDPVSIKTVGLRLLLLNSMIGDSSNTDGPDAWKNNDNSDLGITMADTDLAIEIDEDVTHSRLVQDVYMGR